MFEFRTITVACVLLTGVACKRDDAEQPAALAADEALLREQLDQTVWASETEAQRYEAVFVKLWDAIRAAENKFGVLSELPFESISLGAPMEPDKLDLDIVRTAYTDEEAQVWEQGAALLFMLERVKQGIGIVETEWHHSQFVPGTATSPPSSVIATVLHLRQHTTGEGENRFIVRADLHLNWKLSGASPVPGKIRVKNLRVLARIGKSPGFVQRLKITRGPHPLPTAHPLIVNDLDGDGLSEIIVPRWNAIYRNRGQGKFAFEKMCANDVPLWEAGIIADFNGDRLPDVFSIAAEDGKPVLFEGVAGGRFADAARRCGEAEFDYPSAITAGDIDGDGDLDLWAAQYKVPYNDGQMPTPYYDANDGYPSYLLINDGAGNFRDATEGSGLTGKRHRRTYSSSFVDLDEDGDLDLMVVSDFSGLDLYRNDGTGKFTDHTGAWVGPRHSFGMGHVLDDFDGDGAQDLYVIGMSSTTARRLDRMKLGRDDRPDIAAKRSEMGYGNRMYMGGRGGGRFEAPSFAASVARTGWSWGTTSFDFDNDGDRDIYVGNGHRSGKSTQDYCTRYWCHDVYTGDSGDSASVKNLLAKSMLDLNLGDISWNGYEKNALLNNLGGKGFANVAFLLGTSFSYDARAVVSDDLDADGRPDLLVAQMGYKLNNQFEMTFYGYRNVVETANRWIGVQLRNEGPGLSPIGAKVSVHGARGVQRRQMVTGDSYLSQHANTLHFGLGADGVVERIEVVWPNGKHSSIVAPAPNRYHLVPPPPDTGN